MELEQSKKEISITERSLGSFCLFELDLLKGLPPSAQLVYTYLLSYYNHKTKQCNPNIRTLAQKIGYDKETVSIAIAKLESVKIIIKHYSPGKKSSYDLPFVRVRLYGKSVQLENKCTENPDSSVRKIRTPSVRKCCPEQDKDKQDEINKIKEEEAYEKNFGNHDASEISYIQLVDHWVRVFNIPSDSNLRDMNRMRLSKAALRQYGLPKCIEAIDGCKLSEWYCINHKTDLTHIFKDATTIETHMRRKVYEPIEKTKQSKCINQFLPI